MEQEWDHAAYGAEEVWCLSDVQEGLAGSKGERPHNWP